MRKDEIGSVDIDRVEVEYINFFSPINTMVFSEELLGLTKWSYFLNRLIKKIDITSWKKEYINRDILDGFAWRVTIISKENKKISFYGQNDYPDNWDKFDKLVETIYPERFE